MSTRSFRGAHAPRVLFPAPRRKAPKKFDAQSDDCRISSDLGRSTPFHFRHKRHSLTPPERNIVLRSLLYGHERLQYELYIACVMPDHVHLLFEPQIKEETATSHTIFWSPSEILHGIKSSTAHRINKICGATGPVWDKESFDRLIRLQSDLEEKFSYICRNPWDAKVVDQNEDYPWLWTQEISSARAPKTAGEARALPEI
jgi:putative transposase